MEGRRGGVWGQGQVQPFTQQHFCTMKLGRSSALAEALMLRVPATSSVPPAPRPPPSSVELRFKNCKELEHFVFLVLFPATCNGSPRPTPFTRSEGGQLDNQCGLPSGRGKGWAVCCPHSLPPAVKSTSAGDAQEICFHLFWARLVRKPQDSKGQPREGAG